MGFIDGFRQCMGYSTADVNQTSFQSPRPVSSRVADCGDLNESPSVSLQTNRPSDTKKPDGPADGGFRPRVSSEITMRDVGMTMSPATSNGWVSAQRSPVTTKAVQFDFAGEDFLSDIDAQGLREFIHDSLSVLNKDARANGHEVSSEQDWKNVVLDYKKGDGILEEYLSLMGRRERFDYMAGALGVIDLGEALFDKSLFGVLGHKMSREDQFLAIATHVVGFLATPSEDTIQSYCDLFEISDSLKTTLLESVSARSA